MNVTRLVLAALAATVTYFVIGGLTFTMPGMRAEFEKYPAVYRGADSMKTVFPVGMAAMLIAMVFVSALFAMAHTGPASLADGARFGALIGGFAVCAFVIHNYVNLNIGMRLTVAQAVAYFVEWLLVGVVIAALYRPATG